MRLWRAADEAATLAVGVELAAELEPDGILLVDGALGAGKTVLARGVATALGVAPAEVQSPTFTLIREHEGSRGRFVHLDLYRLDPAEIGELGIEELLAGVGVKVVEWAERLGFVPEQALRLEIVVDAAGVRELREIRSTDTERGR